MRSPLTQARSRLANAVRAGDPNAAALARRDFNTEKLRGAILDLAKLTPRSSRRDLVNELLNAPAIDDVDLL